jgi:hypothetical protein
MKIIWSRDALLADGSNYRKWARCLRELASQFIYNPDFFNKPTTNIHNKKIGRAIILHSVNPLLEDAVSNFQTCYEAMKNLRTQFCSVCRAAQISTFLKLLCVEPDSFETTAAYAVEMRDILSDWTALNIQITEDCPLGFLLQINLKDGPIKHALAERVELLMYTRPLLLNNSCRFLMDAKEKYDSLFLLNPPPSTSHLLLCSKCPPRSLIPLSPTMLSLTS